VPGQPTLTGEFLSWHAQFYFDLGAQYAAAETLAVNDEVRDAARRTWRSPTYRLLERQREQTHEPCRLISCGGRCSRCIHAAAWRSRGGHPYPGVG